MPRTTESKKKPNRQDKAVNFRMTVDDQERLRAYMESQPFPIAVGTMMRKLLRDYLTMKGF